MKAALIQLQIEEWETPQERWLRVERILSKLEGKDLDLICLPELWAVGFSNFSDYEEQAEVLRGTTYLRLSAWARQLGCHIITGSFVEKAGKERYNTTLLLDHHGYLRGYYRKMHLFGYESEESKRLSAGKTITEVMTPFGIWGLATCYDLRFPEQFRYMAVHNVTLFCVTAAWPAQRLEDWRLLCRARALENQSFLIACNHTGTHGGVTGAGHSLVIAPDGSILAEAGEGEEIIFAEMDLNEADRLRNVFPVLKDYIPIK